jgi:glycosyltransferase involved in cell wall biosynthesis
MDGGPQTSVIGARLAGCTAIATYQAPPPGERTAVDVFVSRRSYDAARVCLAPSVFVRDAWCRYLESDGRKFEVVANGVDLNDYVASDSEALRHELGIPLTASIVGMTGRLAPEKGGRTLVEAMPLVTAGFKEAFFVFAGDGREKLTLERRVAELGLRERVLFLGFRSDVARVTCMYDVAVVPSTMQEPFGLTIIEAMAARKAVVASRVGGIPEVVVDGKTGILVPPGNPAALAEGILGLLGDADRRRAMADAGYERVRSHFDRKAMLQRTYSVYESVIARPR